MSSPVLPEPDSPSPAEERHALPKPDRDDGLHTPAEGVCSPVPSTVPHAPAAHVRPTGTPVGRYRDYRVVRELGRGGMGVVYEAEDEQLGRRVALKVMAPALAGDETARRRFLREARAMAAVEHDHIVPVYLVGEHDGVPFIAMPLLSGQTLDARMQGGESVSIPEAVAIARQTAEALAAAHAKGLVHRDVKPSNIWLEANPDGSFKRVRLLDFGLTRAVAGDPQITGSNQVMGTPAYMAPEQAAGAAVDHRADLFSLGCVLYRMVTGQLPFTGNNALAVLSALATTTPLPPAVVNPAVPDSLSATIVKLLAKQKQSRFQTAAEVIDDLSRPATKSKDLSAEKPPREEGPITAEPPLSAWKRAGSEAQGPPDDRKPISREKPNTFAAAFLGLFGKSRTAKQQSPSESDPVIEFGVAQTLLENGGVVDVIVAGSVRQVSGPHELIGAIEAVHSVKFSKPPQSLKPLIACLARIHRLKVLVLQNVGLSDSDLQTLARYPLAQTVTNLVLPGNHISDEGLPLLEGFPQLVDLDLSYNPVTNIGLKHLNRNKGLKILKLISTYATDSSITALRRMLPNCHIQSDGGSPGRVIE